jgi:ketosteroid isomerase-like protein
MNRTVRLAAVCGLAAILWTPIMAKGKSDHDVFKALIEQYWAAWSAGDLEKAGAFYDKSSDDVYFDIAPLKYAGWAEYKEGVKKLFEQASSIHISPNDDIKVTRRGNIVWTSETFHFVETLKDGKKTELQGRHTVIWEKRNGQWIILHEHVSAPLS